MHISMYIGVVHTIYINKYIYIYIPDYIRFHLFFAIFVQASLAPLPCPRQLVVALGSHVAQLQSFGGVGLGGLGERAK